MTDHHTRRCPLHDEHVDPETRVCDHCERDARLDCPACDGEGVIYTRHMLTRQEAVA